MRREHPYRDTEDLKKDRVFTYQTVSHVKNDEHSQ